jgi:hypothetical protein
VPPRGWTRCSTFLVANGGQGVNVGTAPSRVQTCETIEELPDFMGPPADDHVLNRAVEAHVANWVEHIGQLFRISEVHWQDESIRMHVRQQVAAKLGL